MASHSDAGVQHSARYRILKAVFEEALCVKFHLRGSGSHRHIGQLRLNRVRDLFQELYFDLRQLFVLIDLVSVDDHTLREGPIHLCEMLDGLLQTLGH